MTVVRHAYPKPLDDLFMQSLAWSDKMYVEKHALDDKTKQPLRPLYYKSLALYGRHPSHSSGGFSKFVHRTAKRLLIGIILYILSLLPLVGRFVFPAAGFYSLYRALGEDPILATAVGAVGFLLLPKHTYMILVQGWLSSRALTRELLEPYFARITYSDSQKREWFHDREGVLLGFGLTFYLAVRLPLIGPLAYGIASASAAFLLTKASILKPTSLTEDHRTPSFTRLWIVLCCVPGQMGQQDEVLGYPISGRPSGRPHNGAKKGMMEVGSV